MCTIIIHTLIHESSHAHYCSTKFHMNTCLRCFGYKHTSREVVLYVYKISNTIDFISQHEEEKIFFVENNAHNSGFNKMFERFFHANLFDHLANEHCNTSCKYPENKRDFCNGADRKFKIWHEYINCSCS